MSFRTKSRRDTGILVLTYACAGICGLLAGSSATEAASEAVVEVAAEAATNALGSAIPAAPAGPFELQGTLNDRFAAITSAEVVYDNSFIVKNKYIEASYIKLELKSGSAAPIRTSEGLTLGFWFTGVCGFSYQPPLGQETASLERTTSRRSYENAPCTEVLLLADDPSLLAWLNEAAKAPVAGKIEASAWLRYRLKHEELANDKKAHFVDFAVSAIRRSLGAIESKAKSLRVLHLDVLGEDFGRPRGYGKAAPLDWLAYRQLPEGLYAAGEPHVLFAGHFADKDRRYQLNLTSHSEGSDAAGSFEQPNIDLIRAELNLDISVGFDPWAEMEATATLTLTTRKMTVDAIALNFLRTRQFKQLKINKALGFTVSEVLDFKGRPLEFLHYGGLLLVRLRSPLPPGQGEVLKITYHGNAMPRLTEDSFGLLANYPWWPQTGHHDRFTLAVDICTPPAFKVAGTGTTIRTWKAENKACERWEEPVPITFPAINMGRWVSGQREGPSGVLIRAFFLREDEKKIEPALAAVAEMLTFYEQVFGPYPYRELDIAEARNNMSFWQAPAGLLELSRNQWSVRTPGKDQRRDFYPHPALATLAHEVAHQWWGHVVGWKSYRDQWISETFAEYSSFLFMTQYEGKRSYLGRLEFWQQGARRSQRRAPMVLGFRDRRGYQNQVYRRGPHALHLLRRMVGDTAFLTFMGQLTAVAANRNLSTADVETIASKVLGEDIHWFFSEWIQSSGLPSLEADWQQDGSKVQLTLKQVQTGPPFRLLVPVQITTADGTISDHTIATDKREISVQLDVKKGVVQTVRLDPDHEVCLADAKVEQSD